jgi:hypothetical protein
MNARIILVDLMGKELVIQNVNGGRGAVLVPKAVQNGMENLLFF